MREEQAPGVTRRLLWGVWYLVAAVGRGIGGAGRAVGRGVMSVGELRYAETWKRLLVRGLLAVALLTVLYIVVTFVQVWWISMRDGAREADVALVLGAAQYDGRPSPVLADRLDHAL